MSTQSSASPASSALTRRDVSPLWCLQWALRIALGVLFLFAAWNKLHPPLSLGAMDGPTAFAASVQAFKLGLPDWATRFSISVTPWVEVITGLALIFGLWRRGAALVMAGLLLVFIGLIVSVLVRDMSVECGCFGKLSPFCPKRVGMCNIIQNSVMFAGAAYLTIAPVAAMRRAL